jgi:exosortase D (VPLPA-CTERM-specific)
VSAVEPIGEVRGMPIGSENRGRRQLLLLALLVPVIAVLFRGAFFEMWHTWTHREEYSHGPLLPLVALFLAWQRRDAVVAAGMRPGWAGFWIVLAGVVLNALGQFATLYTIQQFALLLVLVGLLLAAIGWPATRTLWVPLVVLAAMVPLPHMVLNGLSAQLQLLSSWVGVWTLRLLGMPVFLEGNVIDLGRYQLQVAEACSGLNYLFPLMTLGFLMACFFRAPLWKRAWVFVSSLPLTVLMNSLRIAMIGVLVQRWGIGMAEGFLHEFQGWAVFMVTAALMYLEMLVLSAVGASRVPLRDAFVIELPRRRSRSSASLLPAPAASYIAAFGLTTIAALAVLWMPARTPAVPERESFATFPLQLAEWQGRRGSLEPVYLQSLKLSDYLLADYVSAGGRVVNLYVAWYDAQRSGVSTHSPRSCLPGGGWRIVELGEQRVESIRLGSQPLQVNRALIQQGTDRQLVYYWFQQRGRIITNEYLVKWYLFRDALVSGRTDGSLVRLVVPLRTQTDLYTAEQQLIAFAALALPQLQRHVPG